MKDKILEILNKDCYSNGEYGLEHITENKFEEVAQEIAKKAFKWAMNEPITEDNDFDFETGCTIDGFIKMPKRKEGDTILDTHVGSASSLIACEQMGFNYIGYELDTDYYNAAKKRLKEETSQYDMFQEPPKEIKFDQLSIF